MQYVFVDCRWSLSETGWGYLEYLAGHIPGATFLDVERDLAGPPGEGGRHPLPDTDAFARAATGAGIGPGVFVVAYGTMGGAERLWWLLRHHGHDDCAVIDLESWRGPLAGGEERAPYTVFQPLGPREDDMIDLAELAERHGELVVVDSRSAARWRGEPNEIDRVPGRVPGAISAPWSEPLPDLPDGELVAYCGSGITACVTLHRLHLQGRSGRLHPGSWSEWEQHDELPREQG